MDIRLVLGVKGACHACSIPPQTYVQYSGITMFHIFAERTKAIKRTVTRFGEKIDN